MAKVTQAINPFRMFRVYVSKSNCPTSRSEAVHLVSSLVSYMSSRGSMKERKMNFAFFLSNSFSLEQHSRFGRRAERRMAAPTFNDIPMAQTQPGAPNHNSVCLLFTLGRAFESRTGITGSFTSSCSS